MSYKNIILVGAGGNLGPAVLKVLISSNVFNITILSRQSSKSTFPSAVKVVKISDGYPSNELEAAFKGQDAVLSFVGGMGVGDQPKLIDAAAKVGVKRFFPSEYGTSLKSPKATEICPMFQGKIDVVDYLRKKEGTGLTWTAVVTGPFFDWYVNLPLSISSWKMKKKKKEVDFIMLWELILLTFFRNRGLVTGFLGFDINSKSATIYDSGTQPFSATPLSTIGRALVSLLQNPSATKANQYVYISSFLTSQNEILAALEKASGTKYTIQKSTAAKLIEGGNAKLGKGDFNGIGDLIMGNLYGGEGNDFERSEELANGKLGLKGERLEEVTKTVVQTGGFWPWVDCMVVDWNLLGYLSLIRMHCFLSSQKIQMIFYT